MKSSRLFQLFFGGVVYAQISLTPSASTEISQWPLQTFKTVNISVPAVEVVKYGQTEQGYLFTTNHNMTTDLFVPYITSDDGQLVWHGAVAKGLTGMRTQTFEGEPVLTYWTGIPAGLGIGYGSIMVLNATYDLVYNVTLSNTPQLNFVATGVNPPDSWVDVHENELTDDGSVLVTAVNVTETDLTSVGGPKQGWILDSQMVELDIKTNEVLFRWSSWEQSGASLNASWLPMAESSGVNKSTAWDWSHLNSAAKYGDKYLINSRHLCTVFLVDKNGNVEWQLNR
ncbi:hypothetical protein Sste5344_009862 [Sporothrix stenoceras]